MRKITLGVREFALPVPRTGSIEINSGYAAVSATGQQVHAAVQKSRSEQFPNYRKEVRVTCSFAREQYRFVVSGLIDGIFDSLAAKNLESTQTRSPGTVQTGLPTDTIIEEIKSSFLIEDLYAKLQQDPWHPYCLQLKTYVYFHLLSEHELPSARLLLVSSRNQRSLALDVPFDAVAYEEWLNKRLDELVKEANIKEQDESRRAVLARTLVFPFSKPRCNQEELVEKIETNLSTGAGMLVQAPTGLGKTVAVMFPVLREALARGQKLVYVTPKNSQHAVAEDAVKRFQKKQKKLRALTITAKSKLCLKEEQICHPDHCQFAKDYYKKVYDFDLVNEVSKHANLSAQQFREYGNKYQVCPFELCVDSLERADIVVADYNYVFSPRSLIGRLTNPSGIKRQRPNLIIDEAHNLPERAQDYYSAQISTRQLSELSSLLQTREDAFGAKALTAISEATSLIAKVRIGDSGCSGKISDVPPDLLIFEEKLRDLLSDYLESNLLIEQNDPILRLCNHWFNFTAALQFEGDAFFVTVNRTKTDTTLKITCCDASKQLKSAHDCFMNVVAFSATMKPFEYYAKLSGFDDTTTKTMEFSSPFPKNNRKLLVIPQVSTKYCDRERNYAKIATAIEKITKVRLGNYFVFFPSFAFLQAVAAQLSCSEFKIIQQSPEMKAREVQNYIALLQEQVTPTLILAVQGGVFSEGVDYPGETLIGAIIVGPALPNYNLEREMLREYYEKTYGSGFDYAYTYPAMSKVIQSAGRVIRSETDRGLIVLMDRRFTQETYSRVMPRDWFDSSINELISTNILSDIQTFWQESSVVQGSNVAQGLSVVQGLSVQDSSGAGASVQESAVT